MSSFKWKIVFAFFHGPKGQATVSYRNDKYLNVRMQILLLYVFETFLVSQTANSFSGVARSIKSSDT